MIVKLLEWLAGRWSSVKWRLENIHFDAVKEWRERVTVFFRCKPESFPNRVLRRLGMGGFTFGHIVLVRDDYWEEHVPPGEWLPELPAPFITHEMWHHVQCERSCSASWQAVKYVGEYLRLWLFTKKHAYYDNRYEVEAYCKGEGQIRDWKADKLSRCRPWNINSPVDTWTPRQDNPCGKDE